MTDGVGGRQVARDAAFPGLNGISQGVLVGCGGIGLPLAVAFASRGCGVVGIDTDPARLAALRAGHVGDLDEGLREALAVAAAAGRIAFQDALVPSAVRRAFILAVPTPVDSEGRPILTSVDAAIERIAANCPDQDVLPVPATVPIGTTRRLAESLATRGRSLLVAACPDRSVAGRSFVEQFSVPHIVGALDPAAAGAVEVLFQPLGPTPAGSAPEAAGGVKVFAHL